MNVTAKLNICSTQEAQAYTDAVLSLHDHWIARDNYALSTLGAAAYLDAPTARTVRKFGILPPKHDTYENNVEKYNPLLSQAFDTLYSAVLSGLSKHLQAETVYPPDKAFPGFHIFNHHPHYALPTTHIPHYDRQYESLKWQQEVPVAVARTISFTLPLQIPANGAGLVLWDIELNDVLGLDKQQAIDKVKSARTWRENYNVGEMVCHPGHLLHRIAPWHSSEGERRITLQGHGLYQNDQWHLYW